MDYTKLIKRLRAITIKHYKQDSIGEPDFFSDFAHEIHSFLESSLTGYLFSFPFVSEKGRPKNPSKDYLVSGLQSAEEQKAIEAHLKEGGRLLARGECLSVTQLMVENLLADETQSLLIKRVRDDAADIYRELDEYVDEFHVIDLTKDYKDGKGEFTPYFKEVAAKLRVGPSDYEKLFRRFNTFVKLPTSDHFVYLIKPYAYHKEFNVVLILGLKYPLPANDFHLLRLLIYRFVSEVAIKNLSRVEQLKYRTNINYTVHSIKTMLGGLMDSPLNSLTTKYPDDDDLRLVRESKEIIEGLAALLNLITKIEEGGTINSDDLERSKLFTFTQTGIDVERLFLTIEKHRKHKGEGVDVSVEKNNVQDLIPLIKHKNQYASEGFYLLYFLTLIENACFHGKSDYDTGSIRLTLNYDASERVLTASNVARTPSPPPPMESVQGNIKLFDRLLRLLGIGSIEFDKPADSTNFRTILRINGHGK